MASSYHASYIKHSITFQQNHHQQEQVLPASFLVFRLSSAPNSPWIKTLTRKKTILPPFLCPMMMKPTLSSVDHTAKRTRRGSVEASQPIMCLVFTCRPVEHSVTSNKWKEDIQQLHHQHLLDPVQKSC
jgi:hypothetical protein